MRVLLFAAAVIAATILVMLFVHTEDCDGGGKGTGTPVVCR